MLDIAATVARLRELGGDTTDVEVKAAFGGLPASVTSTIGALANRPGGGHIVLGLDERADFSPVLLADPQALMQGLVGKARTFVPPVGIDVDAVDFEGVVLVVARVHEVAASAKPCRLPSGQSFVRAFDGDHVMSPLEEQAFLSLRAAPRFDRAAVAGTSVGDLDADLVAVWQATAKALDPGGLGRIADDAERLRRGGVVTPDGVLTKAGLLALGLYPQEHFPRYVVNVAVMGATANEAGLRAQDAAAFGGPIPRMLDATMDWAARTMRRSIVTGADGHVRDEVMYPLEAVRELVGNALIHRDLDAWSEGMAVEVRLFPDRLVVSSPGGLYGITVDRLGVDRMPTTRNSRLLEICRYVRSDAGGRVVEALATGIPTVLTSMAERQLPTPLFDDQAIRFVAVLRSGPGRARRAPLGETQRRVLEAVRSGHDTAAAIAGALALQEPNTRKALRALVTFGLVDQVGGRGQATRYVPGAADELRLCRLQVFRESDNGLGR